MPIAVGFDVAKESHWAEIEIAETGQVLASHPFANTTQEITGGHRRDPCR